MSPLPGCSLHAAALSSGDSRAGGGRTPCTLHSAVFEARFTTRMVLSA